MTDTKKRIEELEEILESGCNGNCENCKVKKECEELEKLQEQERAESFKVGEVYKNEYTNIFIKRVNGGLVAFIEGFSPSAIHNMQEIPEKSLMEYMHNWGFKYSRTY